MMGRRKAAVFPDPVGAQANISLLSELEKIVEINSQERKITVNLFPDVTNKVYTVCNHSSWNFCSLFSKLMSCYWFIFCLSYIFKTIKIKSPCKENNKVRIVIDWKIYCPFLNVAILDYSYWINTSDVKDYLEIHALQIWLLKYTYIHHCWNSLYLDGSWLSVSNGSNVFDDLRIKSIRSS